MTAIQQVSIVQTYILQLKPSFHAISTLAVVVSIVQTYILQLKQERQRPGQERQ